MRHDKPIQHSKFEKYLRVNELFELIADCVAEQCAKPAVIPTKDEKVVSNRGIHNTGL